MELDFDVTGIDEAAAAWEDMADRAADLTPAVDALHALWMEHRRRDFASEGGTTAGGPWAPLAPSTRAAKGGGRILRDTGRLERSLTEPGHPEHIFVRQGNGSASIGTRVPYAHYHHSGTRYMLRRRPISPTREDLDQYARIALGWIAHGTTDGRLP